MEMTSEQRAEIEKKLAKMSPEELAALQQQQCIFCQIVQGKIPARSLYEDDKIKVVLDINPASPELATTLCNDLICDCYLYILTV